MTRDNQSSQTFVMLAMGLVTVSLSVAMYQHGGLPAPVAATGALAIYVVLLSLHAVVWGRGGKLRGEAKDRRDKQVRRIKEDAKTNVAPGTAASAQVGAAPAATDATSIAAASLADAAKEALAMRAALAAEQTKPSSQRPITTQAINQGSRQGAHQDPELDELDAAAASTALALAEADAENGAWAYRPEPASSPPALPPFVTGKQSARAPAAPDSGLPSLSIDPARSPREADVEHIQDAIKRLLEEVNAAERRESAASIATPAVDHTANEAAIEQSLDALRYTGSAMRAAEARGPAARTHLEAGPALSPPAEHAAGLPAWSQAASHVPAAHAHAAPQPLSPSQVRARVLSEAISAGRIDVLLEPILGLEDQKTRHYEVSVRLRDTNGQPLNVMGEGPDLRGTGLLPLFDSVSISRVAAVARRLDERGKGGSIFSSFSGESIADDQFIGELAETLHQRAALATQLVLSFTQSDVRHFRTPEWDALADMRALGFRFAISSITDLDMDFEALAEQGFTFAKLDAPVFLKGLPATGGNIPANDVCRHLAALGLTLVVEHIESEDQLGRIFGFGVLLGQGHLFGGARPVRADVVTATAAA